MSKPTPTPAALQRLTERLAATDERLARKTQQIMAMPQKLGGDR